MAYCYDNLKLEKGMYHEAGRSFTQVLYIPARRSYKMPRC